MSAATGEGPAATGPAARETPWRIAALALLLLGAALTAHGLFTIGAPQAGKARNLLVWLVLLALVGLPAWRWRLQPRVAGALVAAAFALVAGQAGAVLAAAFVALAATALGATILRRWSEDADRAPHLCFLVGAGVLGTALSLTAKLPVHYPGVHAAALVLVLLACRRTLLAWWPAARQWMAQAAAPRPGTWDRAEAGIVVAVLVHYLTAFLPEIGYDALAMHLFLPAALYAQHGWDFDAGRYVWAVMPLLVDWVYAIHYMLGGETAARLVNVGFLVVGARLAADLARWGGASRGGALLAAGLCLCAPLAFTVSNALFIEAGWSAFLLGGMLLVLRVLGGDAEGRGKLPAAGLLCGFALASKAVTLVLLPALVLLMLLRPAPWWKASGRPLLLAIALGAAVGCIPYATAWLVAGNPVFPFFNGLFKSPLYLPVNFEPPPFERYLRWDSIYRITFDSSRYLEALPGAGGFQWLLLLVPAVAMVPLLPRALRAGSLLFLGIAGVAAVFQQTAYLRYIFPCMAVLCAFIGAAWDRLAQGATKQAAAAAAAAALLLNLLYFHTGTSYPDFPLQAAMSETQREELLRQRHPLRSMVPAVDALNPARAPVVWAAAPLAAGLQADTLYPNWYNFAFLREFEQAGTPQRMADLLIRHGAELAVLDANWTDAKRYGPSLAALAEITDEVAREGGVGLRQLKTSFLYTTELLASPDFTQPGAWALGGGAEYDRSEGALKVGAGAAAIQAVRVVPGRRYLNALVARCTAPGGQGRVQVNWMDARARQAGVSLTVYDCSPGWTTHAVAVRAPARATQAIVYTTGHAGPPVLVRSNSLRGVP